jgi:hypothetical protein
MAFFEHPFPLPPSVYVEKAFCPECIPGRQQLHFLTLHFGDAKEELIVRDDTEEHLC